MSQQTLVPRALGELEPKNDTQDIRGQRGLDIVVSVRTSALRLTGVLHDLIPGELVITLDRPLPDGTPVTIELRTAQLHGEVVYCGANANQYEAHILTSNNENAGLRHAPRFTVDLPARIFAADEPDAIDGRIVDISALGIGLEVPLPLHAGDVLAVESEMNVTFGVVRYCRPLPEGNFRAGAETYHVMPKERQEKKPPERRPWFKRLFTAVESL